MLKPPLLLVFTVVAVGLFLVGIATGLVVSGDSEPDSGEEERATVARVIDGDTVELDNGERVRYLGIDTPELGSEECFSLEATERNRELVEGKQVSLVSGPEDRDRFGRLLRWVFLDDGTFVNAELIWEGYAKTFFFEESRYRQIFVQLQVAASQAGAGGWTKCEWA